MRLCLHTFKRERITISPLYVRRNDMMHFYTTLGILVVLLNKVWGQCSNDSRPLNVTSSGYPQYISSPNFGGGTNYPSNSDCAWLISAPSSSEQVVINVHLAKFDSGDYIYIYDGDSTEGTELGSGTYTQSNILNEFVSTTSAIYITFQSNANYNQDGFEILYFSADSAVQQQCGETLNATLAPQVLMSANFPARYSSDYNCTTYIQTVNEYYTLQITLYFMDVEVVRDCTSDKFEVLEGLSASNLSSLHVACTTAEDYTFNSIDSAYSFIAISLTTDSANDYYGFLLTYNEVFQGINLTYPAEGVVPSFNLSEDFAVGAIDPTSANVTVTSTGDGVAFTVYHDGTPTSLFDLVHDTGDTFSLRTTGQMDYEDTTYYNLTVVVVDTSYPAISASAMFYINLTDVDDNAPSITNLPNSITVYRSQVAGYSVMTVTSSDADGTPAFQQTVYTIDSGDSDSMFNINNSTGEITLARDISVLGNKLTSYSVTIGAYSDPASVTTETLTLNIPLDSPPICTHTTAWGNELNSNEAGSGTVIQFGDPWNCTDEYNISYSISSVSPALTSTLFSISNETGVITMLRSFAVSEVPNRQFTIAMVATDSITQTTTFNVVINVTALSCYPNPRPLYARMDDEVGAVLINDYNCTGGSLTYTITSQMPEGTFRVDGSSIILQSIVYKIRFYSLTMDISDGVDTETLDFKVTIRMKQCPVAIDSGAMAPFSMTALLTMVALYIGVY